MSGIMQSFTGSLKTTVAAGGGNMRALLSASGQTAYDAASNDSWFNVSAADYAAVYSGLAGTSKIGMSDADVTTATFSAFVGTYGITLPQAYCTVTANYYVIAFVARGMSNIAGTFRPYYSTTFKGTYSTLGSNSITTAATNSPVYYLRKNAASAQATTSYVAMGPRNSGSGNWAAMGTWSGAGYSANMTSWTVWNSNTPIQQWLISTSNS